MELSTAKFDVNATFGEDYKRVKGFIKEIQGFQVGLFLNGRVTSDNVQSVFVDIKTGVCLGENELGVLEKTMIITAIMTIPDYAAIMFTTFDEQLTPEKRLKFKTVHETFNAVPTPPEIIKVQTVTVDELDA